MYNIPPFRAIMFILLTFLLCGCNSDIFVDDFTPDVREISMSGCNDVRTIRFGSSDWSVLRLSEINFGENYEMTVSPLGGDTHHGNELEGDGTITVRSALTYITFTRRGADVTIDVHHVIGRDGSLDMILTAESFVTNESYSVFIDINRVRGLEIVSVDYRLGSWGIGPVSRRVLDAFALGAGSAAPVNWFPLLPDGIASVYRMYTTSDRGELLRGLEGLDMPIPSNINPYYTEWAFLGDSVRIMAGESTTRLMYYPPLPGVSVLPGTRATLWADMEMDRFSPEMTVRNTITGEEYKMIIWLDIEQPIKYVLTSNEI